ncbi:MAG: class I SAM-dependent DNA methyltransferase, partial [Sphingobacteriia bacterium]|nr:class I SAM-dependent DNA methyltransferase [Sphingobacteriia bacterium]
MFENHHIKSALSKLLIRQKPLTSNFEYFCECLNNFVKQINPSESEEFNKNLIAEFLGKSFYGKTNHINTKDRIDLAIYANTQNTSAVQVIIEVKSPSNRTEFSTCENINSKALQETVLYFLRERITDNNLEIKHIIITNNYEWFVFNAADFDRLFAQNKTLVKQFKDFETGTLSAEKTSVFYNEIAKPAIEQVKENLPFAYFNVTEKKTKAELIDIYKLLSPQHLLKQQFYNDSNSLNVAFYNELLHIIGLEEKDDAGKKLICRKEAGSRNAASLLESVIYQLGDYESNEERLFDIALNLTITWINRILFLKLLESQMLSYHAQQEPAAYKFLDFKTIPDYDNLNELFFKVLAIPVAERNTQVSQKYSRVPYLNSSLFERTPNEQKYFLISGLKAGKMALSKQTVLKDHTGNALKGDLDTLDYLFRFLDAYDFGSDTSEELTKEASKTLINASVLGLIFEKINGYKDGSFFTPGTITQFMCRETLRRTVVQKFNNAKGWNCTDFTTLYNQIDNITEANNIVNSLKICDPAVGSGHFLVSALNEIIAIKNDLHILQDKNGLRLKEYDITVENDELMIHDENGEPFVYNPLNKESQRIQET